MVAPNGILSFCLWLTAATSASAAQIAHVRRAEFPSLIDATIDDIRVALETGLFSSVDLVTVCYGANANANAKKGLLTDAGIFGTNRRS